MLFVKRSILIVVFFVLSTRLFGQCTLSVNLTSSGNVVCSGTPVTLTASPSSSAPGNIYTWSTGETTQSISVNKAGTYTVTVKDQNDNCPSVVKSITLTAASIPEAPKASNAIACPNTSATLTASGSSGIYQWYDAAIGGTFLASGATYNTPPITAKTVFYVETTVSGCPSARTPVTVYPIAGPGVTGGSTCAGSSVTLTATGAGEYRWYDAPSGGNLVSSSATFTTPPLFATKNYYVIGITNGCVSSPSTSTVIVRPPPPAPTANGAIICSGSVVTLHASAANTATIFDWYLTPSGGTPLITSPDYTTPALTANITYYVQSTLNDCIGPRTPVTVTVNPIPAAPTAADVQGCAGYPVTLTATAPAGTFNWYATATSTTVLATGSTYTTPNLNTPTSFYVEAVSNGCSSTRTAVNVTINPLPSAPAAVGKTICLGDMATLVASGPGGIYSWYDAATGGNLLATNASYVTPALTGDKTYYVETVLGGCTSARTAVTVTVVPPPGAPTANPQAICSGSTATLSASGNGTSYGWYDAPTAGNLLATTSSFTTPALTANTTYYVETLANSCSSPRTAVTVTVSAVPTPPIVSGQTVCAGTNTTLNATSSNSATIKWYNVPSGGTALAIGPSFTTPTLTSTTAYWVEANNGGCSSARTAVTVTVTSTTNQFTYSSGTYCKSSPNPTPVINVPGGTFSAPSGLVINSNDGTIDVAASVTGSYTITYTNACAISTNQIAIVIAPDASFAYNAPSFCQGDANAQASFLPTSSAGIFSATPAGLVFTSKYSGTIDLKASVPGTYTIVNTIDGAGGCPTVQSSITINIDKRVLINAGADQAIPPGTSAQLTGSITGGTTTGTWTANSGTFSPDNRALNAIYTPAAGVSSVTLTLTSDNPGTWCGPQSDQVVINISPQPAPPSAAGQSICAGSAVTLTVIPVLSGIYNWFTTSTGGIKIFSGPSFTTPVLSANATYYVERVSNGVASNRTQVNVTVTQIPVAPTVAPVSPICSGTQATLNASGSTGVYEWYDKAAGGSLLFTGASFITQFLTTNTTYYVQANSNTCVSPTRTRVDVVVNPVPSITSAASGSVCSGTALNYTIVGSLSGSTFIWSRPAVTGIGNPAIVNNTSGTINETLINNTGADINVVYSITPDFNGCTGAPFNYTVTVHPVAMVTSANTAIACSGTDVNYTIKFNTSNTVVSWSRAPKAGISNDGISGQNSSTIHETLNNTTTAPLDVVYTFNYGTANCQASTFTLTVTVNPKVDISSNRNGEACGGIPQGYAITSQVPSAIYTWSRNAVAGNPAVTKTSNFIDETLQNTTGTNISVAYTITTSANGCQKTPFVYTVNLKPQPPKPQANSNEPVCTGKTLNLFTPPAAIAGSSYSWVGPNGFKSTLQNPTITNVTAANAGTYTLYVLNNGCPSIGTDVVVHVDEVPKADAGPDIVVCNSVTEVQLSGKIGGGTTTGIWSTPSPGGRFSLDADLNALYYPTAQDKASGSVTLTLSSTSKDDCAISTDEVVIKFQPIPAVDAGPDRTVCSQDLTIPLAGKMLVPGNGTWTSTGSGTFSPSPTQVNGTASPFYVTGPTDKAGDIIKFTLITNRTDPCDIPSDDVLITLAAPPTADAGSKKFVLKGETVVLTPKASDPNVTYLWSPNVMISDIHAKNPVITGDIDRTYTLQVTDNRGCISLESKVDVKVAPPLTVPNTFTPNGDGVNDFWDVTGLIAYVNAVVDIYDRGGQKVFHSIGYGKPWDGTYNGKSLAFGTYYYVIDTKFANRAYSGYVTIVK